MVTHVGDIDGGRQLAIDGNNAGCPDSVFISGRGFCYEFDKEVLLAALKLELHLFEELAFGVERFLLRQAA